MSDLRRKLLIKKSLNLTKQFPSFDDSGSSNNNVGLNFEKVKWNNYFDEKFIDEDGFCIYRKGKKGPYVFLLHGAGHSSLSWSLVVSNIKEEYRIVAYDMRNHGDSQVNNQLSCKENKYSEEYLDKMWDIDQMTNDAKNIIERIIKKDLENESNDDISLFLIGHSMGGAVASKTVKLLPQEWIKGLMLIDIVEGSAMDALPHMNKVIASRPSKFDSIEQAIKWAYSSRTIKNLDSCNVSIPSQLTNVNNKYVWKVDLLSGEKYWKGWYQGLSDSFLSAPCSKLLLLANTDRLDKTLTIGQMQGKFQLVVLENVGHTVHEDAPEKTAKVIVDFVQRQVQLKIMLEKRLNKK